MSRLRDNLPSIFWKLLSILLTGCLLAAVVYIYLACQLPDVQALKNVQMQVPLKVFSRDGQLIGEFGEIHRTPVPFEKIPKPLINAVLATEDQRFYEHNGVDVFGLLRATGRLLLTGNKSQGGSTITMQVARNFYLNRQKTFGRKLNEILLAIKIDNTLSKEKILELYLNKIYLGTHAYGVASAAQIYYGKTLSELDLAEMAMLAGLPKAPSTINPIANPTAAKARRDHVLSRMLELGYIDHKDYQQAISEPVQASVHLQTVGVPAPYVAEMVRDFVIDNFGEDAYSKGYKIYTTIDSRLQSAANKALHSALIDYDKRHGYRVPKQHLGRYRTEHEADWQNTLQNLPNANGLVPAAIISINNGISALLSNGEKINITSAGYAWAARGQAIDKMLHEGDVIYVTRDTAYSWRLAQVPQVQGAFVSLDPHTGGITSLVGGFDYALSSFNRVTQARRQPGSSFKPFIYASALEKGYTLASIINDAPLVFNNPLQNTLWRPQNDTKTFFGPTRLRVGLSKSRNMVSIRLLQEVGVGYAIDYVKRFGFDPARLPKDLSLALGNAAITPLEMVTGYAAFANGGYKITPYVLDKIVDAEGKTIYQTNPVAVCPQCPSPSDPKASLIAPAIMTPQVDFLMTSALQDVIRSGTGQGALSLGRSDLAGKTGTTNDQVDTWFCGYNSDVVATAWVGFDQPSSLHEYGAQAALPMWVEFMRTALQGKPEHSIAQPSGIVSIKIDPVTGLLANPAQTNAIDEYFRSDTVPEEEAPLNTDKPIEEEEEPLF